MNVPFRFTFAATNDYGVLWNLHNAVTGGTDVDNDAYLDIPDPVAAGVILPLGECWVTALSIMTDSAGAVPCTLGYFDVAANAFVPLYPILATAGANGGISGLDFGEGWYIPGGSNYIPAIRNDGAGAGDVSGHLRLYVPPYFTAAGDIVGAAVVALRDEDGELIRDESDFPIYSG